MPEIDVDRLENFLTDGAALVDVRGRRIRGSPRRGRSPDPARVGARRRRPVPVGRARVRHLRPGGRSARAVEFLRTQSIDAINVRGGMTAWLEAGKPHQTGRS
ncbi:MAG: hypothetical protein R2695_21165 [Acidimicrobiales bacterium]